MHKPVLTVREIEAKDIDSITGYWTKADPAFLLGMGVDLSKMPGKEQWLSMLSEQLQDAYENKKSYCIIWEIDGKASGHSNVNKITFGREAYMHLHLWYPELRIKGCGAALVKMSLPYFFKNMQLKTLYCEPYAHNPAPNKTLEKVGFTLLKTSLTTPGFLNFEQEVNLWTLSREAFLEMQESHI